MGFLALVALAAAIGPLVFDISPATERLVTAVEWIVLALFVAEFVIQFTVATDRATWLRSPWRIVDAICIVGPLLSLLPQVSDTVRGALGFRLLRVGRAVAFSARAGALAVQKRQDSGRRLRRGETKVTIVKPGERISANASSWPELLAWVPHQTPAWYHASSVTGDQLREIAHAAGLSAEDAGDLFNPVGQPRLKGLSRFTAIALWLPTVAEAGFPTVSRNRLFALVSQTGLLTATTDPFDLPQSVPTKVSSAQSEVPFAARTTYRVLELVPQRNQFVANRHEEEILRLEELRVTGGGTQFLNEAFRLQRELSTATADLWRFTALVRKLAGGKLALEGTDGKSKADLDNLLSGSEGLLEKFEPI